MISRLEAPMPPAPQTVLAYRLRIISRLNEL